MFLALQDQTYPLHVLLAAFVSESVTMVTAWFLCALCATPCLQVGLTIVSKSGAQDRVHIWAGVVAGA